MVLLPQTAYWNNYTLSDNLYLALLLAALATGLFWVDNGSKKFALACGILLGLLMNTREERIVALGLMFLLVLFALLKWLHVHWGARWSPPPDMGRAARGFALSVLPLVLACGVLDFSFQYLFFARTGLWAHCRLSTPGLNAYMDAMLRIPHEGPLRRYFLLDKQVRDTASTLSPAFKQRQHLYEEETEGYRRDALKQRGEFDFDDSSFVWCTLVQSVYGDGRSQDFAYEDQMMKLTAREILAGLVGKPQQTIFVRGTFAVNNTVAALWRRDWWPLLRECLVDYTFSVPQEDRFRSDDDDPDDFAMYTAVANRRPSVAKIADTSRDFRPLWIKRIWTGLYDVQIGCLWLGLGAVAATLLVALCKVRQLWRGRGQLPVSQLAVILLLGFIVGTRLAFGTMVEIYFGSHPRYMLPLALVSFPLMLILIDLTASWIHQTGRSSRS